MKFYFEKFYKAVGTIEIPLTKEVDEEIIQALAIARAYGHTATVELDSITFEKFELSGPDNVQVSTPWFTYRVNAPIKETK